MELASLYVQTLRDRIKNGGFAIALSGGGHRATLATLGALLAIVDRGLTPKIIQVASVSGGSITNAFIAQRCRLEKLGPGELDPIATELAATIIRKGVLTKGWMAFLIITPIVLGAVVGIVLRMFVIPWTWLAVVIGLGVALALLMTRGLAVEWLLDRRYFRHRPLPESGGCQKRARLASLSDRDIDHVLCMTDLTLGLPVYASSRNGGLMWRRLKPERSDSNHSQFQPFDAGQLSIATLVRASAAFPGISPRRLRIPPDPQIKLVSELPDVAFLADGGLWNNLGTQVIREDGFIGTYAARDGDILRPYYSRAPAEMPLLCFNGSAPLRPTNPWAFSIPVFALLQSLLRITKILNANTVLPRVDAMQGAFKCRIHRGTRPDACDPANLVIDLMDVKNLQKRLAFGALEEKLIRRSDASVKQWERDALTRLRIARDHFAKDPDATKGLDYILGKEPEPQGSYPLVGVANIDDWLALRRSPKWNALVETVGTGPVDADTTLGRIGIKLARGLIARGYLNTYLTSLFLEPLSGGELDRLADVEKRLDQIVGISGRERPNSPALVILRYLGFAYRVLRRLGRSPPTESGVL